MAKVSIVNLGSYYGICKANKNMIDTFKEVEKKKNPSMVFDTVRKIVMEAPAQTELVINGVNIVMPSTGIIEFGLDFVQITSLIFKSDVNVNIIYMY